MPQLPIYDRVMETTNTTGTGNLTLNGAVSGYRRFIDTVGAGNQTYYTIQNEAAGEWEIGICTVVDAVTLSREEVIASSTGGKVAFSIGQKQVFISLPAQEIGAGGSGGEDKNYVHVQVLAATTWDVTHNLNKYPSVTVVDTANTQVEGDVVYLSLNTIRLEFSAPFSGKAYFN